LIACQRFVLIPSVETKGYLHPQIQRGEIKIIWGLVVILGADRFTEFIPNDDLVMRRVPHFFWFGFLYLRVIENFRINFTKLNMD